MGLHRLHRNLSVGKITVPRGSIKRLGLGPDTIRKLEEVGAISPVSAPPLSEVPDWTIRAVRLAAIGIMDAEQFLEANDEKLAQYMSVDIQTVAAWKEEAGLWLQPGERKTCCQNNQEG